MSATSPSGGAETPVYVYLVAGHRQEDAACTGKPLGDPAGELGDGIDSNRRLLPLGLQQEPRAVQSKGHINLADATYVRLHAVKTPAAQQISHKLVELLAPELPGYALKLV
jgi:hypothetical protein